jgi:hypothetical protein
MPLIAPSGNSEGSIYRTLDGKAYQVINGKDVEVSVDKLVVQAYIPLPNTIVVDGVTYNRDQFGHITFSENGRVIAATEAEMQNLDTVRFGGRLQERLEQEGRKQQQQQQQQKYLLIGGGLLLLILLSRS